MSASIDERVVEMKFDNAEFERGAKDSMNTLKDLDKSLQLENGVKGFAAISDAAGKVNFGALTAGIESVGHSFSAMEVAAITVISRITNSLMDAAKNIGNQLLIDPIKEGMQEYETKMDMVQTTVINSGRSLEEVNTTLDDLNHYADKTIFKFSDMTNALSKFTMSGITDLSLAETMIEGIGNIAGESGLKTEQASSAFYMISQAMSAGKMSLYQWRTLENTGFASMKFKENLLETAAALGKLEKDASGAYYAFKENGEKINVTAETLRNTLTETGWMDSEVMQTIFARYASAEASTALGFEDISESAYHAAQDIKTFSQMWDTLKEAAQSGWTDSWETILGDYEEAKALWTNVNNVISGILDRQSEQRNQILKEWKAAGGRDYAIEALSKMWQKLASVMDSLKGAFNEVFPPMTGAMLEKLTYKVVMFARAIKWGSDEASNSRIHYVFKSILEVVKTLKDNAFAIFKTVREGFREIFPKGESLFSLFNKNAYKISKFFDDLKSKLELNDGTLDKIKRTVKGLFAVVDIGLELIKAVFSFLQPLVTKLFPNTEKGILDITAGLGDWLVSVRDWIKENQLFSNILSGVSTVFTTIYDELSKVANYIIDKFSPAWDVLKESISNAFKGKDTKEGSGFFSSLLNVLKATLEGLGKALTVVLPIFGKVVDFFWDMVTNMAKGIGRFIEIASQNGLGNAITGLTVGFGSLLGLKAGWKITDAIGDIASAIKALTDGFKSIVDVAGGLEELKDAAVFNMKADMIMKLAKAIAIMAVSFILLSMADLNKVGLAFGVITASLIELMSVLKAFTIIAGSSGPLSLMQKSPLEQMADGLIKIAAALLVMSIALTILSSVEPDKVEGSILAITALMGNLIAAGIMLSKQEGNINKLAKSFIKIGVALVIMSVAVKMLAKLDAGAMWQGVGAIGALMGIMVIFTKLLTKKGAKNFDKIAGDVILIAISMVIFGKAIEKLGSLDPNVALAGIITIMSLLVVIDLFSKMLEKQGKSIVYAGVAMIAIAASMIVFAAAISLIGGMKVQKILLGVGAISALILVLALASRIVKPISLTLLSVAIVAISAALLIFAGAMKILSTIPFDVLLPNLLIIFASLALLGVLSVVLAPFLATMTAMVGIFAIFSLSILALGVGITALSVGLTALGIAISAFGGGLIVFITELLSLIPILFEMIGAGIIALIAAVAASATQIIESVVMIGSAIIDGLILLIPKLMELVETAIIALCELIVTLTPVLVETVIKVAKGIWTSLKPYLEKLWPKIKEILIKIKDKVVAFKNDMVEAGKNLIEGLVEGFKAKVEAAVESIKAVASSIVDAAKGILGIHSPSRVFHGIGEYIDQGLANGIRDMAGRVEDSAIDLGGSAIDALKGTIGRIADVISSDEDYNPTITPVLDLSNVESGSRTLSDLLSNQNGGNLTASIAGRLSSISGRVDTAASNGKQTVVNNHYDMTQNNYSPKALSRIELYRQTNNQFERLKGVVSV